MKKREFNKILKECSIKQSDILDIDKINALSDEVKNDMVYFIARNRGPILSNLISQSLPVNWLTSMGYLYVTQSKKNGFVFRHLCEHKII